MSDVRAIEWPTLTLIAGCYCVWALAVFWLAAHWPVLAVIVAAIAIAQQSSLQHEAIHGHPTRLEWLNVALVAPALSLCVPYLRFRDTHLAHHTDETLTDPYDDPESNYLDPVVWCRLAGPVQVILRFNNTLAGRLLIGPLVGQISWMASDWRAMRRRDRAVLLGWLVHIPAAAVVIWIVALSPMPIWAYLIAAYIGHALIKIRTFLEHRAHVDAKGRTVIVEDRGPLALLFLNNNLHVVHHAHPGVPWYRLPQLYAARRDDFLRQNHGYRYRSYVEVMRRHFWRAKDPVPHPLWRD
jgi:fatty acid desaturase